jgi:hypothetical protein
MISTTGEFQVRRAVKPEEYCKVPGCISLRYCKGLCQKHYTRFKTHGSTDKPKSWDRSGTNNPKWRGGQTTERKTGRVLIYSPNHPLPNWKNYVYRYRLVVEARIGRFLLPEEIVHHKNGDCTDDSPDNLQVMTKEEHTRLHSSVCINAGIWSIKHAKCVGCGTKEIPHHAKGLCNHCWEKQRVKS